MSNIPERNHLIQDPDILDKNKSGNSLVTKPHLSSFLFNENIGKEDKKLKKLVQSNFASKKVPKKEKPTVELDPLSLALHHYKTEALKSVLNDPTIPIMGNVNTAKDATLVVKSIRTPEDKYPIPVENKDEITTSEEPKTKKLAEVPISLNNPDNKQHFDWHNFNPVDESNKKEEYEFVNDGLKPIYFMERPALSDEGGIEYTPELNISKVSEAKGRLMNNYSNYIVTHYGYKPGTKEYNILMGNIQEADPSYRKLMESSKLNFRGGRNAGFNGSLLTNAFTNIVPLYEESDGKSKNILELVGNVFQDGLHLASNFLTGTDFSNEEIKSHKAFLDAYKYLNTLEEYRNKYKTDFANIDNNLANSYTQAIAIGLTTGFYNYFNEPLKQVMYGRRGSSGDESLIDFTFSHIPYIGDIPVVGKLKEIANAVQNTTPQHLDYKNKANIEGAKKIAEVASKGENIALQYADSLGDLLASLSRFGGFAIANRIIGGLSRGFVLTKDAAMHNKFVEAVFKNIHPDEIAHTTKILRTAEEAERMIKGTNAINKLPQLKKTIQLMKYVFRPGTSSTKIMYNNKMIESIGATLGTPIHSATHLAAAGLINTLFRLDPTATSSDILTEIEHMATLGLVTNLFAQSLAKYSRANKIMSRDFARLHPTQESLNQAIAISDKAANTFGMVYGMVGIDLFNDYMDDGKFNTPFHSYLNSMITAAMLGFGDISYRMEEKAKYNKMIDYFDKNPVKELYSDINIEPNKYTEKISFADIKEYPPTRSRERYEYVSDYDFVTSKIPVDKPKTVKNLVETILMDRNNELIPEEMILLKEFAKKHPEIEIVDRKLNPEYFASVDPKNGTIAFNNEPGPYNVEWHKTGYIGKALIHELAHLETINKYKSDPEFRKNIEMIRQDVKYKLDDEKLYMIAKDGALYELFDEMGLVTKLEDPLMKDQYNKEFMAYLFGNKDSEFVSFLKNIEISTEKGKEGLLDKFKRVLKSHNIFGLDNKEDNLYNALVDYTIGNNEEGIREYLKQKSFIEEELLVPDSEEYIEDGTLGIHRASLDNIFNKTIPDSQKYKDIEELQDKIRKEYPGFIIDIPNLFNSFVKEKGYEPDSKQFTKYFKEKVDILISPEAREKGVDQAIKNVFNLYNIEDVKHYTDNNDKGKTGYELTRETIENISAILGYDNHYKFVNEFKNKSLEDITELLVTHNDQLEVTSENIPSTAARIKNLVQNYENVKNVNLVIELDGKDRITNVRPVSGNNSYTGTYAALRTSIEKLFGNGSPLVHINDLNPNAVRILDDVFTNGKIVNIDNVVLRNFKKNMFGETTETEKNGTKMKDLIRDPEKYEVLRNKLLQQGIVLISGKNVGFYSDLVRKAFRDGKVKEAITKSIEDINVSIMKSTLSSYRIWGGRIPTENISKFLNVLDMPKVIRFLEIREPTYIQDPNKVSIDYRDYITDKINPEAKVKLIENMEKRAAEKGFNIQEIFNEILQHSRMYLYDGRDKTKYVDIANEGISKDNFENAYRNGNGSNRIPSNILYMDGINAHPNIDLANFISSGIHNSIAYMIDPSGSTRIPKVEGNSVTTGKNVFKYLNVLFSNGLLRFQNTDLYIKATMPELNKKLENVTDNAEKTKIINEYLKDEGKIMMGKDIYYVDFAMNPRWLELAKDNPEVSSLLSKLTGNSFDAATLLVKGHETEKGVYGINTFDPSVFKDVSIHQTGIGNVFIKHATYSVKEDGSGENAAPLAKWIKKIITNSNVGRLHSSDVFKNVIPIRDPEKKLITLSNGEKVYVQFDQVGRTLAAYKNKEDIEADENLLNMVDMDILGQIMEGKIPEYIKFYTPITGKNATSYMTTDHFSNRSIETQGGANGISDLVSLFPGTNNFPEYSKYATKTLEAYRKLSDNVIEKNIKKVKNLNRLYDMASRLSEDLLGRAIQDILTDTKYMDQRYPKEALNEASIGLKQVIDLLDSRDEKLLKNFYPFLKFTDKETVIRDLTDAIINIDSKDPNNWSLNLRSLPKIMLKYKGLIYKSKYTDPGKGTMVMNLAKDYITDMIKQRTSGVYTTIMPSVLGGIRNLKRLVEFELSDYDKKLRKKNLSEDQRNALLDVRRIELEDKANILMSETSGIFAEDSYLRDGGYGVIIGIETYKKIKKHSENLGIEFGIGSKVLGRRTPVDNIDSQVPLVVAGVTEGNAVSIINGHTATKTLGMDYDKDGFHILVADDIFTPKMLDVVFNHWQDLNISNSALKQDLGKIDELNREYIPGVGNTLAKLLGTKEEQVTIVPQSPNFVKDSENLGNDIGRTISMLSNFKNLFDKHINEFEKSEDGKSIVLKLGAEKPLRANTYGTRNDVDFIKFEIPTEYVEYDNKKIDLLSSKLNTVIQAAVDAYNQKNISPSKALVDLFVKEVNGKPNDGTWSDKIYNDIVRLTSELSGSSIKNLAYVKSYEDIRKVIDSFEFVSNTTANNTDFHNSNIYKALVSNDLRFEKTNPIRIFERNIIDEVYSKVKDIYNWKTLYKTMTEDLGLSNNAYFDIFGSRENPGILYAAGSLFSSLENMSPNRNPFGMTVKGTKFADKGIDLWNNVVYHNNERVYKILKLLQIDSRLKNMYNGTLKNNFTGEAYSTKVVGNILGTIFNELSKKYKFIEENASENVSKIIPLTRIMKDKRTGESTLYTYRGGWLEKRIIDPETGKRDVVKRIRVRKLFDKEGNLTENWIPAEAIGFMGSKTDIPLGKRKEAMGLLSNKPTPLFNTLILDKPMPAKMINEIKVKSLHNALKNYENKRGERLSKEAIDNIIGTAILLNTSKLKNIIKIGYGAGGKSTPLNPTSYYLTEFIKNMPNFINEYNSRITQTARDLYPEIWDKVGHLTKRDKNGLVKLYDSNSGELGFSPDKQRRILDFMQNEFKYNPYDLVQAAKEIGIEPTIGSNQEKVVTVMDRAIDNISKSIQNRQPLLKIDKENGLHVLRRTLNSTSYEVDKFSRDLSDMFHPHNYSRRLEGMYNKFVMPNKDIPIEQKKIIKDIINKGMFRMDIQDYGKLYEALLVPYFKERGKKVISKKLSEEELDRFDDTVDKIIESVSPGIVDSIEERARKQGISELGIKSMKSAILFRAMETLDDTAKQFNKISKDSKLRKLIYKLHPLSPLSSNIPTEFYKKSTTILEAFDPNKTIAKIHTRTNGVISNNPAVFDISSIYKNSLGIQELFSTMPKHLIEIIEPLWMMENVRNLALNDFIIESSKNNIGLGASDSNVFDNIVGIDNSILDIERHLNESFGLDLFKGIDPIVKVTNTSSIFDNYTKIFLRDPSGKNITGTYDVDNPSDIKRFFDDLENIDLVKGALSSKVDRELKSFDSAERNAIMRYLKVNGYKHYVVNHLGMFKDALNSIKELHNLDKKPGTELDQINNLIDKIDKDTERYDKMSIQDFIKGFRRPATSMAKIIKEVSDGLKDLYNEKEEYVETRKEMDKKWEGYLFSGALQERYSKDKYSTSTIENVLSQYIKESSHNDIGKEYTDETGKEPDYNDPNFINKIKEKLLEEPNFEVELEMMKVPEDGRYNSRKELFEDAFNDAVKEALIEDTKSSSLYRLLKDYLPEELQKGWKYLTDIEKVTAQKMINNILFSVTKSTVDSENLTDVVKNYKENTKKVVEDIEDGLDGTNKDDSSIKNAIEIDENTINYTENAIAKELESDVSDKSVFNGMNINMSDIHTALYPERARDPEYYDYSVNNLKIKLSNKYRNYMADTGSILAELYNRNPDPNFEAKNTILGIISQFTDNDAIYDRKIGREDAGSIDIGKAVRVIHITGEDGNQIGTEGFFAGVIKSTSVNEDLSGNKKRIGKPTDKIVIVELKKSDKDVNKISIIPIEDIRGEILTGNGFMGKSRNRKIEKTIKRHLNDIKENVSLYSDLRSHKNLSLTLNKMSDEMNSGIKEKLNNFGNFVAKVITTNYYLGGNAIATGGLGALALPFSPIIGGGLLGKGIYKYMKRLGSIFANNIIGTTGYTSQAQTNKMLRKNMIFKYGFGNIAESIRTLIKMASKDYSDIVNDKIVMSTIDRLLGTNEKSFNSISAIEDLGLPIKSDFGKEQLRKKKEVFRGVLSSKLKRIFPKRSLNKISLDLRELASELPYLEAKQKKEIVKAINEYRRISEGNGYNTRTEISKLAKEIEESLNEEVIGKKAKGKKITSEMNIYKRSYDSKKEAKEYDQLSKLLITVNGFTRKEIENLRIPLINKLLDKLSIKGKVPGMEVISTEMASNLSAAKLQEMYDVIRNVSAEFIELPNGQKVKNDIGIDQNQIGFTKAIMDATYKSIGNYSRLAQEKGPIHTVLRMFGNFTRERFLNSSTYLAERKKMYDYIYNEVTKSKDFKRAIKEMGSLGIPVGNYTILDPKAQLSRQVMSGTLKTTIPYVLIALGLGQIANILTYKLDDIYRSTMFLGNEMGIIMNDFIAAFISFGNLLTSSKKKDINKHSRNITRNIRDVSSNLGLGIGLNSITNALMMLGTVKATEMGAKMSGMSRYKRREMIKTLSKENKYAIQNIINIAIGGGFTPFYELGKEIKGNK